MSISIKVENLSKAYQLGQFSTGTISRDIERWWALARGKEDPFLKIGETNDRSKIGTSDIVYSLKDLSFDIKTGDAVGIIGKNGAGKSTLLKVLSRVTSPTKGNVKIKGRIASLLEVGTGFHPELTGRENIFINGAILGMRKEEIKRKFDEIVDFSGVERYIDTPVKRYSSGMYVRLAFAVAAHLDSEILIVDEVLAVGDAEFQKKCLGKMSDISKNAGRTVLFVSHSMQSITSLCQKSIVLIDGQIKNYSNTQEAIDYYQKSLFTNDTKIENNRIGGNGLVQIQSINIVGINNTLIYNSEFIFEIIIKSKSNNPIENIAFWFGFFDLKNNNVFNTQSVTNILINPNQTLKIRLCLQANKNLMPGEYQLGINMVDSHSQTNYDSLDMFYGYPVFQVINGINSNAEDYTIASNWRQGWGSLYYQNKIEIIDNG
jgi:lipopolysaccharide transport system ATP-binding protein